MAAHIYMSTAPVDDVQIKAPEKVIMRWRGEVGPGDDPQGFSRMMAKSRHLVRVVAVNKGAELTLAALEG